MNIKQFETWETFDKGRDKGYYKTKSLRLQRLRPNLGEVPYIALYVDFIRSQLASLCTENLVLAGHASDAC